MIKEQTTLKLLKAIIALDFSPIFNFNWDPRTHTTHNSDNQIDGKRSDTTMYTHVLFEIKSKSYISRFNLIFNQIEQMENSFFGDF